MKRSAYGTAQRERTSGMSTAGSVACVASSMMTRLKRSPRSRRSSPAPVHVEHTTWRAPERAASSAALLCH